MPHVPGRVDGPDPAPWDVGLQNERTGLAWQRTMLAGLACSLLVARLLASVSLTLALVTGVVALATSASLGAVGVRRFRRNARALPAGRPIGDGRTQAVVAGLLVLTGIGALGYVLLV